MPTFVGNSERRLNLFATRNLAAISGKGEYRNAAWRATSCRLPQSKVGIKQVNAAFASIASLYKAILDYGQQYELILIS